MARNGRWAFERSARSAKLVLMFGLLCLPASASARTKITCASDPAVEAKVRSVDQRLELTLGDGRVLKLAGIDPPFPTPDAPELDRVAQKRLASWLVGRSISYRAVEKRNDRWGRIPALVFVAAGASGSPRVSVAASVLDSGLGRFSPLVAVGPCRAQFLAAEVRARKAKLGIWADPYYEVIAASDRETLYDRTGTSVIVEGAVLDVEESAFRTKLFLGARRARGLAVTILRSDIERFRAAGLDPSTSHGKTLRVRGLLDTRFGPQIEISSPDEVEIGVDLAEVSPSPRAHVPAP